MSSLRLALKQSLEETTASTPPPPPPVQVLPTPGRASPHGPQGSGSVASYHTEEDSTSPVPRKRGPGRPRKYPRSTDQPPRKRGRPRKTLPMGDEDAFSSENEFSVGGEAESEHTHEEARSSAASTIQSHWKKTKGKPTLLEDSAVAEPPGSIAGDGKNDASSLNTREDSTAPAPAFLNQSKPVTPPAQDVIDWMRNMPVKRARKAVAPGLRVKVRFVTKVKKEGKVTRKRIWYGGRITAVSKEGSKIRIKYDDKTSEVTQFPDKDVVIDDYLNGKHHANASKFIPPEQNDDDDDEEEGELFGEPAAKEEGKAHETQSARMKESVDAEEPKLKSELSGSSSSVFAADVEPPNVKKSETKKESAAETSKASSGGMKDILKSFSEVTAMPSQTEGHSDLAHEPQPDSDLPKQLDDLVSHPEPSKNVHPVEKQPAEQTEPAVIEAPATKKLPGLPEATSHDATDALAAEPTKISPEVLSAEPLKELSCLKKIESPVHLEKDSNENVSGKDEVKHGAVAPAMQLTPAVTVEADKAEKRVTEVENEKITEADETHGSAMPNGDESVVPVQEEAAKLAPRMKETDEALKTESRADVVEAAVDLPKETVPTSSSEAVAPEPEPVAPEPDTVEMQVSTGESCAAKEQVEEAKEEVEEAKEEGPVLEPDRKDTSGQTSSSKENVQVLPSLETPARTAVDTRTETENTETGPLESLNESKAEALAESSEKNTVLEPANQEAIPRANVNSGGVDVKEAKPANPSVEGPGDTAVRAPASQVDGGTSTEANEEPAKPKRKRGRPPKHRPPADGISQEKGQRTDKSSTSAEQSVMNQGSSEKNESKLVEKSSASKKTGSVEKTEKDVSTGATAKSAGKETSTKPSLTIRIPNLKKVDSKQGSSAKKGDTMREATNAASDGDVSRGKKRSSATTDAEEPPAKRLHIHIGPKGSQDNLSDHSERSTEKGGAIRHVAGSSSKHSKNGGEGAPMKEHGALSPKPKKPKRKRDRDFDSTPRVGPKPGKKLVENSDTVTDPAKADRSSHDANTRDQGDRQSGKSAGPGQDIGDDNFGTPDARTKAELAAARSGRRAAQQANEKISSKNDLAADQATKKKKKRRRDMDEGETERDEEIPAFQWVQCDKCAKWRIIPSSVVETLPPLWYCADNKWDAKRASCDAPEQTPKQVAKERKKKKRKLMMEREAAEAAEREASAAAGETADVSSSPRNSDDAADAHRASPSENSLDSKHGNDTSRGEKKGVSSSKKTKSTAVIETTPLPEEEPKPRGRGRPRRNPPKEVTTPSAPPNHPHSSAPPATDEADNLEWVQCEKCDKWRKLPPHISADELPDVWYCSMNTWNPGSASCSAPEDKADGLQDIFNNNATSGKLSYRNLIFGSNGRKHNRPISERTRAAESLFAAVSDDSDAPPAVMYANSSAFVCRSKHQQSDENDGPTVLDLMSRSHLWTQLQKTQSKATPLVFDALSIQARESLKDIVLHCLGAQTLTGEQLYQQVGERSWENAPLGWTAVRKYCSENMLVMAMCELVRMGVLECFRVDGPLANGQLWTLCYRRARTHAAVPSRAATVSKVDLPSNGSRCMKFAKPWKKPHTAT